MTIRIIGDNIGEFMLEQFGLTCINKMNKYTSTINIGEQNVDIILHIVEIDKLIDNIGCLEYWNDDIIVFVVHNDDTVKSTDRNFNAVKNVIENMSWFMQNDASEKIIISNAYVPKLYDFAKLHKMKYCNNFNKQIGMHSIIKNNIDKRPKIKIVEQNNIFDSIYSFLYRFNFII